MKKILSVLLALVIFIPMVSVAAVFDESPFDDIYNPDSKCWRGVVHLIGPSDQVVRLNAKEETRKAYAAATGSSLTSFPSFAPFIIETSSSALYDSVEKKYHFFAAAVYPLPGINADCVKAVPSQKPGSVTTSEGASVLSKSEVGKKAAEEEAKAAEAKSAADYADYVANYNAKNASDIKGTPLYSGSLNTDSNYKPTPSGLASDCGRGDVIKRIFTGDDGNTKNEFGFQNDCGFDDLMALINKLANFLLFIIVTPFVAIGVCYAGFLYLTSGGSSEKTSQAKSILMNLVIGYIVALLAWIVVKSIMVSLGFNSAGIFLDI